MIVTNPQAFYLLVLLPIVWWLAIRAWAFLPAKGRLLSLILRTSIVSLVVTSLAGPAVPRQMDGTAVVFAVDQSASMSEEMRREADTWVQEALRSMGGRDRAAVVTFGRDPQIERGLSDDPNFTFAGPPTDDSVNATGVERAMRISRTLLSSNGGGRIVLVTDGG